MTAILGIILIFAPLRVRISPSSLLKYIFEESSYATLIQSSSPGRTKDSSQRSVCLAAMASRVSARRPIQFAACWCMIGRCDVV